MKRHLITCALFIVLAITGKAQPLFGVKGGASASYLALDGNKALVSFYGGAFSRFHLSDKLFIQPEVLVSGKGARLPGYFYLSSLDFNFYYLSVPVLFGTTIGNHFSVLLGPDFSYLLDGKLVIEGRDLGGDDNFRQGDFSLDLGLQYRFGKRLGIDARYSHGLLKVMNIQFTDENGQSLGGIDGGRNRVYQLGLFYVLSAAKEKAQIE